MRERGREGGKEGGRERGKGGREGEERTKKTYRRLGNFNMRKLDLQNYPYSQVSIQFATVQN